MCGLSSLKQMINVNSEPSVMSNEAVLNYLFCLTNSRKNNTCLNEGGEHDTNSIIQGMFHYLFLDSHDE
jgi:hypothetical protein